MALAKDCMAETTLRVVTALSFHVLIPKLTKLVHIKHVQVFLCQSNLSKVVLRKKNKKGYKRLLLGARDGERQPLTALSPGEVKPAQLCKAPVTAASAPCASCPRAPRTFQTQSPGLTKTTDASRAVEKQLLKTTF